MEYQHSFERGRSAPPMMSSQAPDHTRQRAQGASGHTVSVPSHARPTVSHIPDLPKLFSDVGPAQGVDALVTSCTGDEGRNATNHAAPGLIFQKLNLFFSFLFQLLENLLLEKSLV